MIFPDHLGRPRNYETKGNEFLEGKVADVAVQTPQSYGQKPGSPIGVGKL